MVPKHACLTYASHASIIVAGLLIFCISIAHVHAADNGGVSLNQTRVIFLASDRAQTLTVKNSDNQTYLIQSRVQRTEDDKTAAPFFITPPLFVLKPDSRQLLRIVPQGVNALPTDRESVFYLSITAIPARPTKDNAPAQLSLGLRFVLKLFYRPEELAPVQDTTSCSLRFTRVAHGIHIDNPTPYHQSLGRLQFDKQSVDLNNYPSMVPPLSSLTHNIVGNVKQAEWQLITDYGGLSTPFCTQNVGTHREAP